MLPCFSVDHLPVLQQSLPDAVLPRIAVIKIRESFMISSTDLLSAGANDREDIIVGDERVRMLHDEVKMSKADLQPVKSLIAVISCRSR